MTYTPTVWADGDCVMAADMNNIENGVDRAQGDVMVLYDLTANIPASDPLLIGRLYIETDLLERIWRDNGAGWDLVPTGGAVIPYFRYIFGHYAVGPVREETFASAGRVFIAPIQVLAPCRIDRIYYHVAGVSGGNIRVGLYEEGGAADSPVGGSLVVESASVGMAGATRVQFVTIAETTLTKGLYFTALQGDTVGSKFRAWREDQQQFCVRYDIGGYGAFTDPCPAVVTHRYSPYMGLRVSTVLSLA